MNSQPIQPVVFGGNFAFTPVPVVEFQEDHATLVGIAADVTGSMQGFMPQVKSCIDAALEACQASPYADFLLARVTEFDDPVHYAAKKGGRTVREILPFTKLADIGPASVPALAFDGNTTLIDACYDGIVALDKQGRELRKERVKVNAILFVITDGVDNASIKTTAAVRQAKEDLKKGPHEIESIVLILIGINAAQHAAELATFKDEVGFDFYIDAGNADQKSLAKLAGYIAESVSSQSQAAGSGRPSQNIKAKI